MVVVPQFISVESGVGIVLKYVVGSIFWFDTAVVLAMPFIMLGMRWKEKSFFDRLFITFIAIICPIMGSLFLYFKEKRASKIAGSTNQNLS
jgi:hypothetical protein